MNTSNILELVLSGIIMGSTCYYIWSKFLNTKYNILTFKFWISFFIFCFLLFFNYYFNGSYYKVIATICFFIIDIKILFRNELKQSIVVAIITEIIFFVSEFIFSIIMLFILHNNVEYAINNFFGAFLTNLIICTISVGLSNFSMFNCLYQKIVSLTSRLKNFTILLLFVILAISVNVFSMLPYYKVDTLILVILNSIILIVYSIIVFKFIQAKNRYIDISDKYSLSEASLKEVQNNVNRLMALNHENKNQLITIRTMVANKDKDVLKNIDAIVDQKIKDDKELKIRTSVISNTMLGSLIYSKLLTMKEKDITHNLHISKAINKSHLINLGDKTNVDICKIVGVYLDNAIEAVMEADVKEINIDLYLEDNYFCISIANTFKGKVNLDIITDYGYTTKSNGHGYGLSLVKEVIKDNNALSSKTDIIDNKVFVQNLKIKM